MRPGKRDACVRERLLGFGAHRRNASRALGGEEHRQLRLGRGERLRLRPQGVAETILRLRLLVLRSAQRDIRDRARQDRCDREQRQRSEREAPHSPASPLGRRECSRLGILRGDARVEELRGRLGEPDVRSCTPLDRSCQPGTAIQQVRILLVRDPLHRTLRDPLPESELVAILIDPRVQAGPGSNERLVHELHAAIVDHQQPVGRQGVDELARLGIVDLVP